MIIDKSDYEEPCCPCTLPTDKPTVPIKRILDKLDEHLAKKDFSSAERHLDYWLKETEIIHDFNAEITLLNEKIGLFRKNGKENDAIKIAEISVEKARSLFCDNDVILGTTYLNAATAYNAFGKSEKAIQLYLSATEIYEKNLKTNDARLAGLYNNTALAYAELTQYRNAEKLFLKALKVLENDINGQLERAITYCNLADLCYKELGAEKSEKTVEEYLNIAEKLFDSESLTRDYYYAFVCEKCAPVFGFYGFFITENELNKRARSIYERS